MGNNWFDALGNNWFGNNWVGGAAAPAAFAMRADRPLAEDKTIKNDPTAKFRDRDWDPDLLAILVLQDFITKPLPPGPGGQTWDKTIVLSPPTAITAATVGAIMDDLRELAITERPEALGEIVQQHQDFQLCWLQLLNISRDSHPATFFVMKLAARVGEYAMIELKRRNPTRPRPSQICPALYPPVPVPGHATYPAGHSIIAHLTSACLADLVPAHTTALESLADRVGFNRVIAGLHFREDVTEGAKVGKALFPFIKQCALYQTASAAATLEWA